MDGEATEGPVQGSEMCFKSLNAWGWRDGEVDSAVKNTHCSLRDPRISSQYMNQWCLQRI